MMKFIDSIDSPWRRYATAVGVASALQKTARKLRRKVIQMVDSVWFDGFGVDLLQRPIFDLSFCPESTTR
jgi:hypothetical protein